MNPTDLHTPSAIAAQHELERLLRKHHRGVGDRQRRYTDNRERAMRLAERDRVLREWREPVRPSIWQQIRQELAEAPIGVKVGFAAFVGAGVGAWIALVAGWLK